MAWADLLAKQGDLAEIYYRQRQALKLAKGREENRRAREKKKLANVAYLDPHGNIVELKKKLIRESPKN